VQRGMFVVYIAHARTVCGYMGHLSDRMPIVPVANRYEGEFAEDLRTGSGKYIWPSGEVYEGEFVDGQAHGRGHFISKDKDWSIEGHVIICFPSAIGQWQLNFSFFVVAVAGCRRLLGRK
jgi:hypothetical protein